MTTLVLKATKRSDDKKVKELRKDRRIPAVVYGPSFKNTSIDLDYGEFRKILLAASEHIIFDLDLEGNKTPVIVKKYDMDPVTDEFIHIDLYAIDEKTSIIVPIPLAFEGVSSAMKIGAILDVVLPKLKIKVLPKDIPNEIVLDISVLEEEGDNLRVADAKIGNEYIFMANDIDMIAQIEFPRARKETEDDLEDAAAESEGETEGEEGAEGEAKDGEEGEKKDSETKDEGKGE